MDWNSTLASALIILGAALMLVNIISHRQTVRTVKENEEHQNQLTKTLINTHLVLMTFFFFGYIGVLYLFINRIEFISSLFVSIIFFFGAVFVFLGIVIQKRMFTDLNAHNIHLQEYNERLKIEQRDLIEINNQLKERVTEKIKARENNK